MINPSTALHGREEDLLRFMKQNGYSVYHASNIFLRDLQYGVRDYFRVNAGRDIGSRETDHVAVGIIASLEEKGVLKRTSPGTWVVNSPEFLNQPKQQEEQPTES